MHRMLRPTFPAAALMALLAAPVLAQEPPVVVQPRIDRNLLGAHNSRIMHWHETERLRRDLHREQDRRMNMRRPPRPEVPVLRPPCIPTGHRLSRGC